jgi:hypothetical protein
MAIPSKLTIAKGIGGAIVATITAFVGLKTLATPTPSQQPGSITAIGGSAVVTGSNNVSANGSDNQVVSGSQSGFGNGPGSTVIIQQNVTSPAAPKATNDSAFGASADLAKRLYGIWDSHYVYSAASSSSEANGAMAFLRNGAYNYRGVQTVRGVSNGTSVVAEWNVADTGTWIARDGYITVQSNGFKTLPVSLNIDGKTYDIPKLQAQLALRGLPPMQIESFEPTGLGTTFKLLSLNGAEMRVQAQVLSGGNFDFVAKRRPEGS